MAVENDGCFSVPATSTPSIASGGIVAAAINSINSLTNNNIREPQSSPVNNNIQLQHPSKASETSSNGSLKKSLNLNRPPPPPHYSTGLINSSREDIDITSLGGGSSINSNQSIKGDGGGSTVIPAPTTGKGKCVY